MWWLGEIEPKVQITCQHLEFCLTKSDLTYPLAIFILQELFTTFNVSAEIKILKLLGLGRKHKNTEKTAHQSRRRKLLS
jgi:hypothetical protein